MKTDNYCAYNKDTHRYVLKPDYVLERMNIDLYELLNTSDGAADVAKEPELLLERVSRQIYGYVYNNTAYPFRKERELALDDGYRGFLMSAMAEQLAYILTNGDLTAYAGVNPITGTSTDPARVRAAEIAPMAQDILQNSGIISRRIAPFPLVDEHTYEKDGY